MDKLWNFEVEKANLGVVPPGSSLTEARKPDSAPME